MKFISCILFQHNVICYHHLKIFTPLELIFILIYILKFNDKMNLCIFEMLIQCISFKQGKMRRKETDYEPVHTRKEKGD